MRPRPRKMKNRASPLSRAASENQRRRSATSDDAARRRTTHRGPGSRFGIVCQSLELAGEPIRETRAIPAGEAPIARSSDQIGVETVLTHVCDQTHRRRKATGAAADRIELSLAG